MSTKKMIIIGIIVYALFNNENTNNANNRYFILPSGQRVREEYLPQYGYIYYNGQWISSTILNQYTQQQNSSSFWQNLANNGGDIINAGTNLWNIIQDIFENDDLDGAILTPDSGGDEYGGWV